MQTFFLKASLALLVSLSLHTIGCAPRTTVISSKYNDVQTNECITQREICHEAEAFRREYGKMPEEERKDMAAVLNSYIEHCMQAQKECEKSAKKANQDKNKN